VRGVKKTDEGGGRDEEDTGRVRRMRREIHELKAKARDQDEVIRMLKAALVSCMSRTMHERFNAAVEFQVEYHEYGSREDMPAWRLDDCLMEAKQEATVPVADGMMYMTHLGPEKDCLPSKLAVEAFGEVVGYNDYTYKDMAADQKQLGYDDEKQSLLHRRLFAECRELDWKKALKEGREFHDYSTCVMNGSRHYATEKCILLGEAVPEGREGYVIPMFSFPFEDDGSDREDAGTSSEREEEPEEESRPGGLLGP